MLNVCGTEQDQTRSPAGGLPYCGPLTKVAVEYSKDKEVFGTGLQAEMAHIGCDVVDEENRGLPMN